jgi:hypothetical protein
MAFASRADRSPVANNAFGPRQPHALETSGDNNFSARSRVRIQISEGLQLFDKILERGANGRRRYINFSAALLLTTRLFSFSSTFLIPFITIKMAKSDSKKVTPKVSKKEAAPKESSKKASKKEAPKEVAKPAPVAVKVSRWRFFPLIHAHPLRLQEDKASKKSSKKSKAKKEPTPPPVESSESSESSDSESSSDEEDEVVAAAPVAVTAPEADFKPTKAEESSSEESDSDEEPSKAAQVTAAATKKDVSTALLLQHFPS